MGVGTTAIVARELGRNYVGIELNEDYVRLAEERLGK
jgi:DNA modification methylase